MNNHYIARLFKLLQLTALLLIVGAIFYIIYSNFTKNSAVISLYRFNSGISFKFDLNQWQIIKDNTFGDTLVNNSGDISIILNSLKNEDSAKTLDSIVFERIDILNKENINIKPELINIKGVDFYKIDYKDSGDENIKSKVNSLTYATLYNGFYTTLQVIYSQESNLLSASTIIDSIEFNQQ